MKTKGQSVINMRENTNDGDIRSDIYHKHDAKHVAYSRLNAKLNSFYNDESEHIHVLEYNNQLLKKLYHDVCMEKKILQEALEGKL